jgi:hypothetical protein
MSKGEREDLQRLVRQREKVLRSAAKQRSAELLADFEDQMGAQYAFDAASDEGSAMKQQSKTDRDLEQLTALWKSVTPEARRADQGLFRTQNNHAWLRTAHASRPIVAAGPGGPGLQSLMLGRKLCHR